MRRSDVWGVICGVFAAHDGATADRAGVVTHCSPVPTPALMTTTLSTDLPAETVRASFDALLEGRPASAVIGGPNAQSLLGLISRVDGLRSRTPSSVVTVTFESDTPTTIEFPPLRESEQTRVVPQEPQEARNKSSETSPPTKRGPAAAAAAAPSAALLEACALLGLPDEVPVPTKTSPVRSTAVEEPLASYASPHGTPQRRTTKAGCSDGGNTPRTTNAREAASSPLAPGSVRKSARERAPREEGGGRSSKRRLHSL